MDDIVSVYSFITVETDEYAAIRIIKVWFRTTGLPYHITMITIVEQY